MLVTPKSASFSKSSRDVSWHRCALRAVQGLLLEKMEFEKVITWGVIPRDVPWSMTTTVVIYGGAQYRTPARSEA